MANEKDKQASMAYLYLPRSSKASTRNRRGYLSTYLSIYSYSLTCNNNHSLTQSYLSIYSYPGYSPFIHSLTCSNRLAETSNDWRANRKAFMTGWARITLSFAESDDDEEAVAEAKPPRWSIRFVRRSDCSGSRGRGRWNEQRLVNGLAI